MAAPDQAASPSAEANNHRPAARTVELSERAAVKLQQIQSALLPHSLSSDQLVEMGLDALAETLTSAAAHEAVSPRMSPPAHSAAVAGIVHSQTPGGQGVDPSETVHGLTLPTTQSDRYRQEHWSKLSDQILGLICRALDWAPAHISMRPRLVCKRWAEGCARAVFRLTRGRYLDWSKVDTGDLTVFPKLQNLKVSVGSEAQALEALSFIAEHLKHLKTLALEVADCLAISKRVLLTLDSLPLEEVHLDAPDFSRAYFIPRVLAAGPIPRNMSFTCCLSNTSELELCVDALVTIASQLRLSLRIPDIRSRRHLPTGLLDALNGLSICKPASRNAIDVLMAQCRNTSCSTLKHLALRNDVEDDHVHFREGIQPSDVITQAEGKFQATLVSLDLSWGRISTLRIFSMLTALKTLRLRHSWDSDLSRLTALKSLQDLDMILGVTGVVPLPIMESLASLTALTRLCLVADAGRTSAESSLQTPVAPLTALQGLCVLNLQTECTCGLDRLVGLPHLYHLCLRNAPVTNSILLSLASGLPALTILDCGGCQSLTPEGVCMALAVAPPLMALGLPSQAIAWELSQLISSLPLLRHVYVSDPELVDVQRLRSPNFPQWVANAMTHISSMAVERERHEGMSKEKSGEMLSVRTLVYELLEEEMGGKFRERPYANGLPERPNDWEDWWCPDDDSDDNE